MKEAKKLTPKHWRAYNAIKRASGEGRSLSQKELCQEAGLAYQETSKHGDHCRELWDIVQDINGSPEVDEVINADKYEYRIATADEADAMVRKLSDRALKILSRRSVIMRKMRQNGQGKLIDNRGREMAEASKAKPFHETYLEGRE